MVATKHLLLLYVMTGWLSANRYLLLCGLVLFKVAIDASNGGWYGDFWEHSAVVTELMRNPFSPQHPQLNLDVPHAFYSPYSLALAFIARTLQIGAIQVLALAGMLNFLLLAYGLRSFVGLFSKIHPRITAFYALLFVLFLWGENPWSYSGFFHFWILGDVLPYPSTFCVALSLIALSLNAKDLDQASLSRKLSIFIIALVVLLSHPLTFVFLNIGLGIQLVFLFTDRSLRGLSHLICQLVVGFIAVFGLAMTWPYFSILELLTRSGGVYHIANLEMYSQVFQRIWPILFLLPLTSWALHDRNGRWLLTLVFTLASIYVVAYWTRSYSFGRMIGMIALLLQILMAEGVARIELRLNFQRPILKTLIPLGLILFIFICSINWIIPAARRGMTIANSLLINRNISNQQAYKNISFLSTAIKQNDLVISDLQTSWLIPTFGGRVIAAQHPLAFVPDQLERKKDLEMFFDNQTNATTRQEILRRYKPKYLIIDKQTIYHQPDLGAPLTGDQLGDNVYENERYKLILLNQDLY
jgi:hypothetical protein